MADLDSSTSGLDALYVADDGAGITKYSLVGSAWLANSASGYNGALSGTPTLLASAPSNTAFRGVALAPQP